MSNVIPLFGPKAKTSKAAKEITDQDPAWVLDAVEANKEKEARKAKERLHANKSVLRSYRIKS